MNLITFLDGKKTYIISGITAVSGLIPLLRGDHYVEALGFLLTGAFGGAIRAAIKKVEARLPAPVAAVVEAEVAQVAPTV